MARLDAALRAALSRRKRPLPSGDPAGPSELFEVKFGLNGLSDGGVDELAAQLMSAAVSAADEDAGRLLHQAARDVAAVAIARAEERIVRIAEQVAAEAAGGPPCSS